MVKRVLCLAMYCVFLFLFSFVSLSVLFGQVGYTYNLVGLFALVVIVVVGIVLLIRRIPTDCTLYRQESMWFPLALTLFLLLQLLAGWSLRFESAFDFAAVYKGAVSWAETGTFVDFYDYFDWFPNNLGAMTFLSIIFKFAKWIGIRDYFFVGVLVNSVMATFTLRYAYLIVRKMTAQNSPAGIAVLLFFMLNPACYMVGAAFYTDALSMLFPVMFYYYYLCFKKGERSKRSLVLMSLAGAVGILIKSTVLIMVVAVLIDALMNRHFRKMVHILAGVVAMFVLFSGAMHGCLYTKHLNRDLAARKNTPIGHWIMMGLNQNSQGAYNGEDYVFTRSFEDPDVRDAAIRKEIQTRLKTAGVSGTTRLVTVKLTKAFGDGTFALSDFLDDGPLRNSWLHSYVLYDSPSYWLYKYCTQVPLLVVYFFVLVAGWNRFRKMSFEIAPFVAIIGLMLFLAFWESSSRYFLNFVPVIYCIGALGIDQIRKH